MEAISSLNPQRVFHYFEAISKIPRGSGNQNKISSFCEEFARTHYLKYNRDTADNIIIYKDATSGYEDSETIILQGHLDMVCQKTPEKDIDFENDGIDIYAEDGYIRAKGTTLGADNGIAVAMILAILESETISHPAIEAIFTTDEEIGMLGAMKLDFALLKGKRMINIDSEQQNILTVSCAGGSDFRISIPFTKQKIFGTKARIEISGLKGGHSGVMIDAGRVNADILMGRLLDYARKSDLIYLSEVNGGDKGNAIPPSCVAEIICENPQVLSANMNEYIEVITAEICDREPDVKIGFKIECDGEFDAINKEYGDKVINSLMILPNGVIDMSVTIENLVETSLNLGILQTQSDKVILHYTLRSNKMSAMNFLEKRLISFADAFELEYESFGHYPAWEFCKDSKLQEIYKKFYKNHTGEDIKVCAIHAGLECGVFASAIEGFDCISIGPDMNSIHTTDEELNISSTQKVYEILLDVLKNLK